MVKKAKYMGPREDLRGSAEEHLLGSGNDLAAMPDVEMEELVQELQVYQVELEMQNAELRRTQVELDASRDRYLDLYDFTPSGSLPLDPIAEILCA